MPRPRKTKEATRLSISASLLPRTVEDLAILARLRADSRAGTIAEIVEDYFRRNPIDDEVKERFRRLSADGHHVTPFELVDKPMEPAA